MYTLTNAIEHVAHMLALQLNVIYDGNLWRLFRDVEKASKSDSVACSAAELLIMARDSYRSAHGEWPLEGDLMRCRMFLMRATERVNQLES